jgi:hypothetical protein
MTLIIKKRVSRAWVFLIIGLLAGGEVYAQNSGRLEISSNPRNPAASVWIDGQPMDETPLSLPYLKAGTHTVRVARHGSAIERRVLLKPGAEVELVADFLTNEIRVTNRNQLGYEPVIGKNVLEFTSTRIKPAPPVADAPKEPDKPEPGKTAQAEPPARPEKTPESPPEKPAPKPEDKVPATGAEPPGPVEPPTGEKDAGPRMEAPSGVRDQDTAEDKSAKSFECVPGEWCPQPEQGQMGPPVPPETMERIRLTRLEEEAARVAREEAERKAREEERKAREEAERAAREEAARAAEKERKKQEPPRETRAPVTGPRPPCARKSGAAACATYGEGIRDVVYKYYCLLANNDFEKAFTLWYTDRDLAWFYKASKSFCGVHDYQIRGFQVTETATGRVDATYVVDLKDSRGQTMESWQMRTVLVRRAGAWRIRTVSGNILY